MAAASVGRSAGLQRRQVYPSSARNSASVSLRIGVEPLGRTSEFAFAVADDEQDGQLRRETHSAEGSIGLVSPSDVGAEFIGAADVAHGQPLAFPCISEQKKKPISHRVRRGKKSTEKENVQFPWGGGM